MKKLNLIVVFNNNLEKVLFCIRAKEPYKGLYNFVGGKVEEDESLTLTFNLHDEDRYETGTVAGLKYQDASTLGDMFTISGIDYSTVEIYLNGSYAGCISKEFSLFKPMFDIDYNGWHVEGDFWEWDYSILNPAGACVATVSKELFKWTDTYVIDVNQPQDALAALMLVLAIDAEKCSRN